LRSDEDLAKAFQEVSGRLWGIEDSLEIAKEDILKGLWRGIKELMTDWTKDTQR